MHFHAKAPLTLFSGLPNAYSIKIKKSPLLLLTISLYTSAEKKEKKVSFARFDSLRVTRKKNFSLRIGKYFCLESYFLFGFSINIYVFWSRLHTRMRKKSPCISFFFQSRKEAKSQSSWFLDPFFSVYICVPKKDFFPSFIRPTWERRKRSENFFPSHTFFLYVWRT